MRLVDPRGRASEALLMLALSLTFGAQVAPVAIGVALTLAGLALALNVGNVAAHLAALQESFRGRIPRLLRKSPASSFGLDAAGFRYMGAGYVS